ncbi:MAG: PTS transporter subunit EIIC [Clostridiaceae bacterium]|nr:PTS transporter subunit EIIC [Clostridiaceae bacterium]
MAKQNKVLGFLQKLGKSLMTPIAALPAAALMLRLGQPDVWKFTGIDWMGNVGITWMAAAGGALFDNLALLFAVGIAVGLADENNGVAGLAGTIGFLVLTAVAKSFDKTINMGVLSGIFAGIIAAKLYNKYNAIKLPDFLGFFGGRRFVPIVTSFWMVVSGVIAGFVWPLIQDWINAFGNTLADAGPIGAFFFGIFNRGLIPVGLHHVLNSLFWFQFGTFENAAGKVINGDLHRFFALDPSAGTYMTGFFPIMMFGLPAACIAMISAAKKENRKAVSGMLLGIAFTSFLTGITEPIEFTFMFIAPVLYGIHALLTGVSLAITSALGIKAGFGFSAGAIDALLNWNISTKPFLLVIVGLIFAVIYYFVFLAYITKFNVPTPGREDDGMLYESTSTKKGVGTSDLDVKAAGILEAVGTKSNITTLDACVTRIRLTVKDGSLINQPALKQLGASGVMKLDANNFQIVVGTMADPLVSHMKTIIKNS